MDTERQINSAIKALDKKDNLVTPGILQATFTDPKFLSHLVNLTHHAHLNLAEGGFSVQNINGEPVVSDLAKSPKIGSVENLENSYSTHTNMEDDSDWINTGRRSKIPKIKPNIILSIHSHPVDPYGDKISEDALAPSRRDLEAWEKSKLTTRNEYLIEGIIVKKGNTGLLLLFQEDPSKLQDTYYQAWEEHQGRNKLLELMKASGIRYGVLKLDIENKRFPEKELEQLKQLAIN